MAPAAAAEETERRIVTGEGFGRMVADVSLKLCRAAFRGKR